MKSIINILDEKIDEPIEEIKNFRNSYLFYCVDDKIEVNENIWETIQKIVKREIEYKILNQIG